MRYNWSSSDINRVYLDTDSKCQHYFEPQALLKQHLGIGVPLGINQSPPLITFECIARFKLIFVSKIKLKFQKHHFFKCLSKIEKKIETKHCVQQIYPIGVSNNSA